ncbi:MAG: Uma2 family endonuclease [Cyclobacteriaceae bacterium]|nr:Uma2 family endonuclease [Cyclobacteriaceae bacterium HetDA_MAG_MS6]
MIAGVKKRLIKVDEYYRMAEVGIIKPGDHVELIKGEILEMSPIGSRHAGTVKKLNKLFNRLFDDQVVIGIQDPIRVDEENEPEPDVSILSPREDSYTGNHPTPEDVMAVIEVADSSYEYDFHVKSELYANADIPEYWLINLEKNRIEVYTSPVSGSYGKKQDFLKGDKIPFLDALIPASDII